MPRAVAAGRRSALHGDHAASPQTRAARGHARRPASRTRPRASAPSKHGSLQKKGARRRWGWGARGAGRGNGAGGSTGGREGKRGWNTDRFCSRTGGASRQGRPGVSNTLKAGVNLNASNTRKMPPTKASGLYSTFPLNPTRLPVTSDTARQKLSFTAHGQHRGQRPSVAVHPAPDAPLRAADTEL